MKAGNERIFAGVQLAADRFSAAFNLRYMDVWALIASWTDTTPGSGTTFTAASPADDLTSTAHGLVQEQIVRVSTTTTLPSPLAVATDYFVIFIDANTFRLATTRANAIAGTQIDITDDGTGTHTVTAQAISVTMTVQYANTEKPVAADWVDDTLNIVMTDTPLVGTLEDVDVGYRFLRLKTVVGTGGSGLLTVDITAKGGS